MSLPIYRNLISHATEGAILGFTACAGVALAVDRLYHAAPVGEGMLSDPYTILSANILLVINAGLAGGTLGAIAGAVYYKIFGKSETNQDHLAFEQYV